MQLIMETRSYETQISELRQQYPDRPVPENRRQHLEFDPCFQACRKVNAMFKNSREEHMGLVQKDKQKKKRMGYWKYMESVEGARRSEGRTDFYKITR